MRSALLALSLALLSGCDGDGRLSVDVYTDLVAGEEFDAVEIRLLGRAHPFDVTPGQSFLPVPERFGPLRAPRGATRIEVVLVDDGEEILSVEQTVLVSEETVVPIYLLRSCLDVTCPDASDPMATVCQAGRCVRPDCDGDAGPGCPPVSECTADVDCPAPVADCARALCLEGHCVVSERAGGCATDAYCDPDRGCVPRTMPVPDAGMPDAGPPPECSGDFDCPGETATGWTACQWTDLCGESAPPRTRMVTRWSCLGGSCVSRFDEESEACVRSTMGTSCGTTTMGPWSACTHDAACPRTGRRRADVMANVCSLGSCVLETTTVEDTSTCPPPTETCNRIDDDCNGTVDDGFGVYVVDGPEGDVLAHQPGCGGYGGRLDFCLTASTRFCSAHPLGCFVGGAGMLGPGGRVACFGGGAAQIVTTYSAVSAASGIGFSDTEIMTRVVSSAANRFCTAMGYAGGIGPIEHADPTFVVMCLPASHAQIVYVDPADMRAYGCDAEVDVNAPACLFAADMVCRLRGYEAGWGPLEWNPTTNHLLCLRG